MIIYSVYLQGKPVGKQRPKFNRSTGVAYTPRATTIFESALKIKAQKEVEDAKGKPIDKACMVSILVNKRVPPSWSKKKKEEYVEKHYPVLTKPDLDNIAKSVLDALNGVFYTDDRYVASLSINKAYSDIDSISVVCSEWGEELNEE